MVVVDRVEKSFGSVRAVRSVSFELPAGQVVGLLGPNGAGKTTTIRMVTGYTPPDAGRVVVCGHDMSENSAAARSCLGYLPESAPLYHEMRVIDYVDYRARLVRIGRGGRKAAVGRALERCWLGSVSTRRIGQLSKGYKQRVGLAGALVHEPRVLVLDEPTNGLDPAQVQEMRKLVRELGQERTLLLSSHILTEVERLCDRVIVMAAGQVQADGTPGQLLERARLASVHVVEIKASGAEAALSRIRQLVGVAEVAARPVSEYVELRVTPKAGVSDLREPIAIAAREGGWIMRTLRREEPSLERVFLELVERAGEARP